MVHFVLSLLKHVCCLYDVLLHQILMACLSVLGVGGLKLWEGSLDLVKALSSEVQNGQLSFTGKRVLEVGILTISGECILFPQCINMLTLEHAKFLLYC